MRSSDVDRCLVSAYSDLAGLFSNASIADDVALPFVKWQPIPAHSIPVELDEVFTTLTLPTNPWLSLSPFPPTLGYPSLSSLLFIYPPLSLILFPSHLSLTQLCLILQLLAMQRPCRAVDVSKAKVFDTDYVKAINRDYKEFFEYLMLVTGVNLTENAFRDVWVIHDTLFCEVTVT